MSTSSQFNERPQPLVTAALSAGALVLGIPVAAAALVFEKTDMPNPVLGTKEIKTAPGETATITFNLLSGPQDAVMAGGYISIIASILLVAGIVISRHVSRHNIWGWAVIGPALLDLLGQIGILAYVNIVKSQNPEAKSADEVTFANGKYDTQGKLYTREAWACMMDKFYPDRETWAEKACSDLKIGALMPIPLAICGAAMVGLASFMIWRRGGFGWLIGRRKNVLAYSNQKTGDYIDLQPTD
ncbi:hypothetical protein BU24DRAFT_449981 [Aaosphaeria arxii CBS 175.79]|uniref:Uncharacterized protein n=1 Tax=Aaosphaeria arxii CBS 175.79 TaxID=1450172 RepID=A0A6A5XPZ5_9PLEO|nr:uncharacterized protein BU24DRAFT_449981 [Aaosphaeria arxii CBS 175.79]KAF2015222.1 hypothetical protein BU24DRAFT_449981 [Aaosphaeria arxii CBS 175.79]